jgi:small multidrug resistance family-3 protein
MMRAFLFVFLATVLEVTGDAVVRKGLYQWSGGARIGLMGAGAILLLGYGASVNLAPFEFRHVVGLYLATLFVIWQIGNVMAFHTWPTVPILVGGSLIVAGGLIVTFWSA